MTPIEPTGSTGGVIPATPPTMPAPRPPGFWGWVRSRWAPFANAIQGVMTTPEAASIFHNMIFGGITLGGLYHLGSMLLTGLAPVAATVAAGSISGLLITWGQLFGKLADNTDSAGKPTPPASGISQP